VVSEHKRKNPIFSSTAKYSEKVYRKLIKKMNREMKL